MHSLEIESKSRKETMKMILETLEDIQADYNEAQNTNNAILEDFREEIQVRFEAKSLCSRKSYSYSSSRHY